MSLLRRDPIRGLRCPYCGSTTYSGPKKKFTTGGVIFLVAGLILTPICIGLLFLLIAFNMRETKYKCGNCKKLY
ncbi:MAG TPA: LITAF-like zinc ribbon domain-containing protein [Verrucomicrobiae bacterium]|nr:LITAF-like zinc ribbon domain-containing protein [Verrucomicrobiae bacterium]